MLSAKDVSALRAVARSTLVDSADILRRTSVTSPTGGTSISFVYHSTHPALLTGIAGKGATAVNARIASTKNAEVRLPPGAPVFEADKLRIDGFDWLVQSVIPYTDGVELLTRVVVSRT